MCLFVCVCVLVCCALVWLLDCSGVVAFGVRLCDCAVLCDSVCVHVCVCMCRVVCLGCRACVWLVCVFVNSFVCWCVCMLMCSVARLVCVGLCLVIWYGVLVRFALVFVGLVW